jgi:flavodoxin I
MPKILVLYYSRSGNTEKMAEAVVEGAKSVGNVDVELSYHVDVEDLSRFDAVLVGANGINLKGKVGAAFGSYGWSGEAPNYILEIMKNKFKMQVIEPPLLAKDAPDEKMLDICRGLGKLVSETLMHQA